MKDFYIKEVIKMKVNYIKRWGNDGTCYRQTIKIDKTLMEQFNLYLAELKEQVKVNFAKNRCYTENDLKIQSLEFLRRGVNYTNLIHLSLFLQLINVLNKNGKNIDFKRILWRNTIMEVI